MKKMIPILTLGIALFTAHAVRSMAVHGFKATYKIGESLKKGDRAIGAAITKIII